MADVATRGDQAMTRTTTAVAVRWVALAFDALAWLSLAGLTYLAFWS